MRVGSWLMMCASMLAIAAGSARAQGTSVTAAQASEFLGTWVFTMTEPDAFRGSQQTLTLSERDGIVSASIQIGKFPSRPITAMHKDGDMLVLSVSHAAEPAMLENGAPIWAVICLTREGDGMRMAQMLERSQTIKRGTGKKVGSPEP